MEKQIPTQKIAQFSNAVVAKNTNILDLNKNEIDMVLKRILIEPDYETPNLYNRGWYTEFDETEFDQTRIWSTQISIKQKMNNRICSDRIWYNRKRLEWGWKTEFDSTEFDTTDWDKTRVWLDRIW